MTRKLFIILLSLSMLFIAGACSDPEDDTSSPIQDKWLAFTVAHLELSQVQASTFALPPQAATNSIAAIAPGLDLFGKYGAQDLLPALDATFEWLRAQQSVPGGLFEDPAGAATPHEATYLSIRAMTSAGPTQFPDTLVDLLLRDTDIILNGDAPLRETLVELRWTVGALGLLGKSPSQETCAAIVRLAETFAESVDPANGQGFIDLTVASAVLVELNRHDHSAVNRLRSALHAREETLTVEDLSNVPELLANVEAKTIVLGESFIPQEVESRSRRALASCYDAEQLLGQQIGIFQIIVLAYAANSPTGQHFPALTCLAALQLSDGTFGTTAYRSSSALATEMALQTFLVSGVTPRQLDQLWAPARPKCDLIPSASARELLSVARLQHTHPIYDCGDALEQRLEALLLRPQSLISTGYLVLAGEIIGSDSVVGRGLETIRQFEDAMTCDEFDLLDLAVVATISSRVAKISSEAPSCVSAFITAFQNETDFSRLTELEVYAYLQLSAERSGNQTRRMSAVIDQFIISSSGAVDAAQACRVTYSIHRLRGDRLEGWCDL